VVFLISHLRTVLRISSGPVRAAALDSPGPIKVTAYMFKNSYSF